jgi:purine-binding chemotaxis protein CheW
MSRPLAQPGALHRNGGPSVLVVDERAPGRSTPHQESCLPDIHIASSLRDRARARTGTLDVLLFRVADESFAIDLSAVEEAIDIPPVHHVPEMPHAMLGVITVRGTLTAVYSPAAALGVGLHDGTSALIFRRERSRVAVVVDEVDDVVSLDLALLRDTPTLEANDGAVLGVVRQGDSLLALVDAEELLAACQAVPLLETA